MLNRQLSPNEELWAAVTAANLTKGQATVPASTVLHGIRLALMLEPKMTPCFTPVSEPPPAPLGPSAGEPPEREFSEEEPA